MVHATPYKITAYANLAVRKIHLSLPFKP
ncbi:hypothetical protein PSEUDO9AZ_10718 [Pseudomonas sp. 9AZ]|nr:hypothetical protein PSEUDO9AZ_10718 [Pseudomonas sp. 9AZ]